MGCDTSLAMSLGGQVVGTVRDSSSALLFRDLLKAASIRAGPETRETRHAAATRAALRLVSGFLVSVPMVGATHCRLRAHTKPPTHTHTLSTQRSERSERSEHSALSKRCRARASGVGSSCLVAAVNPAIVSCYPSLRPVRTNIHAAAEKGEGQGPGGHLSNETNFDGPRKSSMSCRLFDWHQIVPCHREWVRLL